jgi:hypothetical protein
MDSRHSFFKTADLCMMQPDYALKLRLKITSQDYALKKGFCPPLEGGSLQDGKQRLIK